VSYTKLDSSIIASTVWVGTDSDTKVVWIAMLALRDKHHVVEASIPGLAKLAGVSVEATQKAIELFLSPDPYSRTKDFEGRRIEAVEGGWRLLNGEKYRAKGRSTERTDYFREYQRQRRATEKAEDCQPPSTTVSTKPPAKKKPEKFDPLAVPIPLDLQSPTFEKAWRAFVEYRDGIGKPFKTENGPVHSFRLLSPLGPERAASALRVTMDNEWQGVKYGIAELLDQEKRAGKPSAPAAHRSASQQLELERRKVTQRAFATRTLTPEQRDSIVAAAEKATCLEDLERILWPNA